MIISFEVKKKKKKKKTVKEIHFYFYTNKLQYIRFNRILFKICPKNFEHHNELSIFVEFMCVCVCFSNRGYLDLGNKNMV